MLLLPPTPVVFGCQLEEISASQITFENSLLSYRPGTSRPVCNGHLFEAPIFSTVESNCANTGVGFGTYDEECPGHIESDKTFEIQISQVHDV